MVIDSITPTPPQKILAPSKKNVVTLIFQKKCHYPYLTYDRLTYFTPKLRVTPKLQLTRTCQFQWH